MGTKATAKKRKKGVTKPDAWRLLDDHLALRIRQLKDPAISEADLRGEEGMVPKVIH